MMTLAPELPGALELSTCSRPAASSSRSATPTRPRPRRMLPSIAASARSPTSSTRCGPLTHRDPASSAPRSCGRMSSLQAIVDGVHLDRDVVRLLWSVAAGRFALVTDAIAAAGLGDGDYALGSVDLAVNDGIARRDDGILAGSTLTMIQARAESRRAGRPARAAPPRPLRSSPRRPRARRSRPPRDRPAAPMSSCSTTTSRSTVCSSQGRPVSQAEAIAPVPGTLFRSEIFEQPAALERLLAANDEIARIAATARRPQRPARAHGRARLLRQCGLVRRLRLRPAAALDCDA